MTGHRTVTLRASGVRSIVGDHPQALLGGVMSHMVAPSAGEAFCLADQDGNTVEPLVWPADDLNADSVDDPALLPPGALSLEARLANLLADALTQTLAGLAAEQITPEHLLLSLPATHTDNADICRRLRERMPALQSVPITQCNAGQLGDALQTLWAQLALPGADNPLHCALFAGADSALDMALLEQRLADGNLRTRTDSHGRAGGEAAACVALVADAASPQQSAGHLDLSLNLALGAEPLHRDLEAGTPTGLAKTAETALNQGSLPAADLQTVVLARAETAADEFEWYQTRKTLWPVRLDESQRKAMRRGELQAPRPEPSPAVETLRPALAVGDTGGASLPLALALAWARFDFFYQQVNNCLVLYSPDGETRLALLLQRKRQGA